MTNGQGDWRQAGRPFHLPGGSQRKHVPWAIGLPPWGDTGPSDSKSHLHLPWTGDGIHKSRPDKSSHYLFPAGTCKTKACFSLRVLVTRQILAQPLKATLRLTSTLCAAAAHSHCHSRAFPGSAPALDSMFCSAAHSNLALSYSSSDPRGLLGISAMRGGDTPIKPPSVTVPSFPLSLVCTRAHAQTRWFCGSSLWKHTLCRDLCWVLGIKDEPDAL